MAKSISKSALKPKLLNYLRLVEQKRESLIITDRGRPVAQIIPFTNSKSDRLNELKGSVLHYEDPLKPVGLEDWELS